MLILTVENIRCWTGSHTFKFESKFVLLSGMSGKGKSSLLEAIVFCLYGKGNKIITHGLKTCKVTMVYSSGNKGSITIVRSKGPNRVVVDGKYEDIDAEKLIGEKFGTYREFMLSSYIQQKSKNSFLSMSPTDKLEFLEGLMLTGCDVDVYKNNLKLKVKGLNMGLCKTQGEIQALNSIIDSTQLPVHVDCPFKKMTIEEAESKQQKKLQKCRDGIQQLEQKISLLNNQIHDTEILNTSVSHYEDQLQDIRKCREDDQGRHDDISGVFIGEADYCRVKKEYRHILQFEEYIAEKDKYDNLCREWAVILGDHVQTLETNIQESRVSLDEMGDISVRTIPIQGEVYSLTLDELTTCCRLYKGLYKELSASPEFDPTKGDPNDELSTLRSRRDAMKKDLHKKEIELKMSCDVYSCPECSAKLLFKDNELTTSTDTSTDINSLTRVVKNSRKAMAIIDREIEQTKSFIAMYGSVDHKTRQFREIIEGFTPTYDLDTLKKELMSCRKNRDQFIEDHQTTRRLKVDISGMEEALKNTNNKVFSGTIGTVYKNLLRQQKKMDSLSSSKDAILDIDTEGRTRMRESITTAEKQIGELKVLQDRIEGYDHQIVNISSRIDSLLQDYRTKYSKLVKLPTLRTRVEKNIESQHIMEQEFCGYQKNLDSIAEYKQYMLDMGKIEEWKSTLDKLQQQEKDCVSSIKTGEILKDKIVEAESIAVTNLIVSINSNVRDYLDAFFEDDPIEVEIHSFKDVKHHKKPQINIKVGYKGMDCDINSLSGGEYDRVQLAFTMAISDMVNAPLLLLDESISSLDEKTSEKILHDIHANHCRADRVIINVAHQVCSGSFEEIIPIG
jgi:DNA repair exonuclease SbcCD ATPase subunit